LERNREIQTPQVHSLFFFFFHRHSGDLFVHQMFVFFAPFRSPAQPLLAIAELAQEAEEPAERQDLWGRFYESGSAVIYGQKLKSM
jgi:hypothetical protein